MRTALPALVIAAFITAEFGIAACKAPQDATAITDGLSDKQRRLVPIAALTASGKLTELRAALNAGLDAGWTINELKEVLVQMYAYAGFPRSLNALEALIDVLDERRARGIDDPVGRELSPVPTGRTSIELGTEIQTRLVGGPATGRYVTFAPAIDTFLKGHLFGDIFGRDNLDEQSREIATISTLATLEGLDPQLAGHFNVGMNVGLTEAQLRGLAAVIDQQISTIRGDNARSVLAQVVSKRQAQPPPRASAGASGTPPSPATITIRGKDAAHAEAAPTEHFAGSAQVTRLFSASSPARAAGASVTFEASARTAWHVHPLGQTLIVTAGTGMVQQWGEPAHVIREGDVVSIPPGVKHWHGGAATSAMTHLAIQEQRDGNTVEWLEPVSDAHYLSAHDPR